jgi:hypothetical protein
MHHEISLEARIERADSRQQQQRKKRQVKQQHSESTECSNSTPGSNTLNKFTI